MNLSALQIYGLIYDIYLPFTPGICFWTFISSLDSAHLALFGHPFGLILPVLVYISFYLRPFRLYTMNLKRSVQPEIFSYKNNIFTCLLNKFKCLLQHAVRIRWNNPDHMRCDMIDHVTIVIPEFALSAVPSNHANIQSRLLSALQ